MGNKPQISLQTFTIRKYLKNQTGAEEALKKVKSLGINALELARIEFSPGNIDFVMRICKREEIKIRSTQIKLSVIKRDLSWMAELHKKLDCPYCVVSVISLKSLKKGREGIKDYACELNRIGAYLKDRGVSLLFHHHNFEFVPIGKSDGFSILKEYLDPGLVGLVLDTYWLQRSGLNPASFIKEHKGLVKGVHLRDFQLKPPHWSPRIIDAELGQGNLDFRAIAEACYESDVDYMAIEQTTADPWKSLMISVDHLKEINLENHIFKL